MKFVADDGTVFDTQEDCEAYENYTITPDAVANILKESVTLYNRKKDPIDLSPINDKHGIEWLDDFFNRTGYDDCYYLRITCSIADFESILEFIDGEYSVAWVGHPGLFYWDDGWVSYETDKQDFERRWKGIAY